MTSDAKNEHGDGRAQYKAQVQRRILGMMLDEGVAGFLVDVGEVLADQAKRHGNLGEAHDVIDIDHVKLTNASDDFAHHGKLLHGMVAKVEGDEKADGLRFLVTLGGNTVERLRRYAGRSADTSVEGVALRLLAQLDVLTRMGKLPSEDDTAEFSARCDASEELRRLLGICQSHESMPLSASETVAACKAVEELLSAKAKGYGECAAPPRAAHFAGVRFTCRKAALKQYAAQPGRSFVTIEASNVTLLDVEAAEALRAHAEAGTVAMLYGPKTTGIAGWATICAWPTLDTIRENGHDETSFEFEVHATKDAGEEWSRHRNGHVPDAEPLPVADLRMGTTVPDMGELKEWLADHLKLTWAARFPKLDHHTEDNADLANAFADEHRALCDSLDKVFHDGTKEPEDEEEAPDSFEGVPSYRPPTADLVAVMDAAPTEAPVAIGVLEPLSAVEQSVMGLLARMPHGPTDASVYRSTDQEEIAACEKLVSHGYLVEENTHPTIGRNWSLTPKGHAFNRGTKPTSEDSPVDPWRTIEGVLVVDAERSILRTLVTAGLGASMVTHSAESPAVRAAGRRLRALGYLASAGQPYPAEVMLTDKGRHLALHTVEPGDALPFIAIDGRELSDAEVEQNTFAMIRGGTCVSAAKGADPHQAGGTKTNAALRRLAAVGLIEQWEDEDGIAWGTKETRARLSPPAPRAPEPTTISADPLLDAAEDAMLNKLRQGPIVSDPKKPFSELTYEALISLNRKGLVVGTHSDLTDCTTWQVTKPADADGFSYRDASERLLDARVGSRTPPHASPFEGNPLDANDPRNEVHALVAEHGGFGKALAGSTTFTRDGLLINGKPHALNDAFKLVIALLELLQQAPSDVDGFGFIDGTKLIPSPSGSSRAHVVTCQAYAGLRHDLLTKLHGTLAAATDSTRRQLSVATGSLSYWTAELATLAIPNA